MIQTQKPEYSGHRNRIKEKYRKGGLDGWLDYEILELALTYIIPRKDTKPIAKELLVRYKTISGVLGADNKDLESVKGISTHSALFIKFLKDIAILYLKDSIYQRDLLSSPQIVVEYLTASLKGSSNEEFIMLFLDSRNQLIAQETIKSGTVNQTVVFPRTVVERALYHHSVGVIIAHNHPSGALEPSQEDRDITKVIKNALKTVDIALLDHIIIGGNGFFSFKEKNIGIG